MRVYPAVLDEYATLAMVLAGRSLARFGDGEFNLCLGGACKAQPHAPSLAARLRGILYEAGDCLVGLPNLRSQTPKRAFWEKYDHAASLLDPRTMYVSSFVTRPDSAPWIDTPAYWEAVESLWVGREVILVRGSERSLTAADLVGAASMREIVAPRENAWSQYAQLLRQIGTPERVLLCLGPTATVLAVDLCAEGVHAIDCGHLGMFWKKHRRGEPMIVTEQDKAA